MRSRKSMFLCTGTLEGPIFSRLNRRAGSATLWGRSLFGGAGMILQRTAPEL